MKQLFNIVHMYLDSVVNSNIQRLTHFHYNYNCDTIIIIIILCVLLYIIVDLASMFIMYAL